jgi:hypothetical protein
MAARKRTAIFYMTKASNSTTMTPGIVEEGKGCGKGKALFPSPEAVFFRRSSKN